MKKDVVQVNLTELQGSNAAGLSSPPQASQSPLAQTPQGSAGPQVGFNSPAGFEMLQRAARMLSSGTIFPERFRNNIGDCAIVVDMALRLSASPLFVAQNLYVVYGSPAWSSKFLIGLWNSCGRYSAIRYEFSGTEGQDGWGCIAKSKEWATGEELVGPLVTLSLAKKEGWFEKRGSKWQTMPALMLRYRAATFLINTVAPELGMGIRTVEEAEDIGE